MSDSVADLAARQYGLIARAQASGFGLSRSAIAHRLETGAWEHSLPGVYRLAGSPVTGKQRAMAASLWAGPHAAVSHLTTAALYRFSGAQPDTIEVTIPRAQNRRTQGVRVHRAYDLPDVDIRYVGGIRCTSPARTIIDCAGLVDAETIMTWVHHARMSGLTTMTQLAQRSQALGPRAGRHTMRSVLTASEGRALESRLEVRVAHILSRSGLPSAERQREVVVNGRRYRLDFAWSAPIVAAECEGWDVHGRHVVWKRDKRRLADLASQGWVVVPITWDDTHAPDRIITWIRDALARS